MEALIYRSLMVTAVAVLVAACGGSVKQEPATPLQPEPAVKGPLGSKACQEPRPEFCTQQYLPACGYWTEGPKCEPDKPCPAVAIIKSKTYSNSCMACSDKTVRGVKEGECPA